MAVRTQEETKESALFCVNHPKVETSLRCNRCGDPICARCAVRTPVGYRCRKCVRQQQATYYTGLPVDYIIAALVGLPTAAVGAYIVSFLGFFFAIFVSPVAGAAVADIAWRAVGRRRSRNLWVIVCGSVVIATLGVALYQAGVFSGRPVTSRALLRPDLGIYLFMAVSAAYGRLRMG
jgi:hypothetical protein